ncbi:MAG: DUF4160 domain-containing protein [Planctomycetota bacterium]
MPEISRFFGIIMRMFYNEHAPPHVHAEYQGEKALFDFRGNIVRGRIGSKTAVRLVREWIDLHEAELEEDWNLARAGRGLRPIEPLK